ncbi:RND family transporter [Candidatus Bipolaricaulota bacterium]|nr:RND family transporter [Candidatus Bipolaricaulota bacterium]
MNKLTKYITDHPVPVLILLAAITLGLLWFVPQINFLADFQDMLPLDNPAVSQYEDAKDSFSSQSVVMVAVEPTTSFFDEKDLNDLYSLTEEFGKLKESGLISGITSPTNVELIKGIANSIKVESILSRPPEDQESLQQYEQRVLNEEQIKGNLMKKDGSAGLIVLEVDPKVTGNTEKLHDLMNQVETITENYESSLNTKIAGDSALIHYTDRYMKNDLKLLFPIAVAVVIAVLGLSFATVGGVLLPLGIVLVANIWTLGLMALFNIPLTIVSIFLPVLLTVLGSAYGIHVLNEYYEKLSELSEDVSPTEIVQATMEEMNVPVLLTSLTTAAGFLSLLTAFLNPIKNFGLFSAIGVIIALILSLVALPALLALKSREEAPSSSWLQRKTETFLKGMGKVIEKHQRAVLALAMIVFIVFLFGIPSLQVETNIAKYFHSRSPVVEAMDFIGNKFGGSQELGIVIDTGEENGLKDPELLQKFSELQNHVESLRYVGSTSSLADAVKEVNYSLRGDAEEHYKVPSNSQAVAQEILLYEMGGGSPSQANVASANYRKGRVSVRIESTTTKNIRELVNEIDAYLDKNFSDDLKINIVGIPQIFIELSNKVIGDQVKSLATSLVVVWLIVALMMSTLTGGLIALLPLIFTIGFNFGLMGLTGVNLDLVTAMVASIVIGVGVDYGVHFINRYRNEICRGADHGIALQRTLTTSGKGIAFNAITLTAGMLVLCLSNFGALVTFGWIIALTMVISSTTALFIIPATLLYFDPEFLHKELPNWLDGGEEDNAEKNRTE